MWERLQPRSFRSAGEVKRSRLNLPPHRSRIGPPASRRHGEKTMIIKRIDVLSAGKISGIIAAAIGLIAGLVFLVFGIMIAGLAGQQARKSKRLNSSHSCTNLMPSSA